MKRSLVLILAAGLAAACGTGGSGGSEAARWRSAGKVYALVDMRSFYARMQKTVLSGEPVTVKNTPPSYQLRDGGMMVYLSESAIPAKAGFTPMTPHQAAEAALKEEGATGLCVEPDSGSGCGRRLDRAQAEALEAELKADGGAALPFSTMVKP